MASGKVATFAYSCKPISFILEIKIINCQGANQWVLSSKIERMPRNKLMIFFKNINDWIINSVVHQY